MQFLTATVMPSNATDKTLTWESLNDAIATVQNGKVTACSPGNTYVRVYAGSASADCKVIVTKKIIRVSTVSLSPSSLQLKKGEETSLSFSIEPSNAEYTEIRWSSGEPKVATVTDVGKVSAIGKGSTEIMLTIYTDYGEFKATCPVSVVVPATGISLDKTTASIKPGETLQLNVTVSPEDAEIDGLKWQSTNDALVKVDQNGLVTGVADGDVIITVSLGSLSASCTIKCTSATTGGNEGAGFENW